MPFAKLYRCFSWCTLFFPCEWLCQYICCSSNLFVIEEKEGMWRILLQKASSAILSFPSENDKTSLPRKPSYLIVNPNLISKFTHLLPLFIEECIFLFFFWLLYLFLPSGVNTVDFMQRVNNQTKAIQQGIKTLRGEVRPETVREAVKNLFFRKEAVKKSVF